MSDPRQARPGAGPRPPAVPMGKPQPPRAPTIGKPVSPKPPGVVIGRSGSQPDLPPSDDWENAPTATSMPDDAPAPPPQREATAARRAVDDRDDRVETPRNVPPVAVAEPSPQSITKPMPTPDPPRAAAAAALANAAPAGMSPAMREEVWTIVRAAVDQALVPVAARYKEMEAKIAALQAAPPTLASPAKTPPPATAASRLASIPVAMGSLAPPVKVETVPPSSTVPEIRPPMQSVSVRPKGSPEGYGVSVMPSMRPQLDLEGVTVEKDEYAAFDGGKKKKRVVKIVAVLMLLIAIAAVTLTILSQSGNSPL